MPNFASLQFWGTVLNFAGGALLSYDPIYARKRVVADSGAKFFLGVAQRLKLKNLKTESGEALNDSNIKKATAERSEKLARYGFLVMTAGFLFDLLGKS
jgi:hypothetical protein